MSQVLWFFETITCLHEPRVILFGGKRRMCGKPLMAVVQQQSWLHSSSQCAPLLVDASTFTVHLFLDYYSYPTWPAQPPEPKKYLGVICARAFSAKDCGAVSMGHGSPAKTTTYCVNEQFMHRPPLSPLKLFQVQWCAPCGAATTPLTNTLLTP